MFKDRSFTFGEMLTLGILAGLGLLSLLGMILVLIPAETLEAMDIDSQRTERLSAEIEEEVASLGDLLLAMEETYHQ